jgi:hypothetical protein
MDTRAAISGRMSARVVPEKNTLPAPSSAATSNLRPGPAGMPETIPVQPLEPALSWAEKGSNGGPSPLEMVTTTLAAEGAPGAERATRRRDVPYRTVGD